MTAMRELATEILRLLYRREMTLFPECRPQCAQTVLDTADLVTDGDVTTTITNGRGGIQLYESLSHNKSDGVKSNMSTG
jgi:hypothetical protein